MRKRQAGFDRKGKCDMRRYHSNRDYGINIYCDVISIRRPNEVFKNKTKKY